MPTDKDPVKHQLKAFAPAVLLVLAAFVVAFQFIKPAPPSRVVMATGSAEGAYHAFAQRYAEIFAREGIELVLRNSAGSVENIALLRGGEVDLALVQGGVDDGAGDATLQSLGSVYYEPLWLFHRRDLDIDRISELKQRRIAVGQVGSGTRALVTRLLRDNGVSDVAQWVDLGGRAAVDALTEGRIDALFLVMSAQGELVARLLHHPDVAVADFARAKAYSRRYPFLSFLELPEGAVDLAENIPDRPVRLLAPTANLVSRPDLHPAVIDLLLIAAQTVHRDGGWFEQPGEFPKAGLLAFPLSDEAQRFYEHGPPFLQRFLPFWAASLLDRIKVMLLPLLVLLIPLIKVMPPIYHWRMRARIYRWYDELEMAEERSRGGEVDSAWLAKELDRIEGEVRRVKVPSSFTDQLYHLREHIDLVRRARL
ncbi:MAG: ABC transporter substrate-binding protein [Gammaproteobacteria bacterium]|nr:ABC transporter substrate-binding protein [Gammaproteobacteria bacterium]